MHETMKTKVIFAAVIAATAPALVAHDRIGTKVTWEREIAPIVQARCATCHSPGGRAPMPLTTYEETRPWARAIREEVLARRMPKWPIVRGYGDLGNDRSLSPFEIALITAWVDGGSPRTRDTAGAQRPASPAVVAIRPPDAKTPSAQATTVPCSATRLPNGRILGLVPALPAGGSLRLSIAGQPVLWVKDFDPRFGETYWLRQPITVTGETHVEMTAPAECRLTVLLAPRTGQ